MASKNKKKPCKKSGRYAVGSSELLNEMQYTQLPTKIGTPVVEGNTAAVEVITDLRSMPQPEEMGRIVFFLNKTDVGWRIVNGLDFANWPITDGKYWGDFWHPPTPWKKQFEAPCRNANFGLPIKKPIRQIASRLGLLLNFYTDNQCRTKLKSPWQRCGQKNKNSSCWVRVSGEFSGKCQAPTGPSH